jgi:hypothetical protein
MKSGIITMSKLTKEEKASKALRREKLKELLGGVLLIYRE